MAVAEKIAATRSGNSNSTRTTNVQPAMKRVVSLQHPMARQVLDLRTTAQKLVNGPSAYRSVEFARWHKSVADMLAELFDNGLQPEFEDRFYQRAYGQLRNVLTENQIYAAFKADMLATSDDLKQIIQILEQKQRQSSQSILLEDDAFEKSWRLFGYRITPWVLGTAALMTIVAVGVYIII